MKTHKRKEINSLHICKALIKAGYVETPNYKYWLARKKWTLLEASCLLNGIDTSGFFSLREIGYTNDRSVYDSDCAKIIRMFLLDIRRKIEIMRTWLKQQDRVTELDEAEQEYMPGDDFAEEPLKLINTYLLTIGNMPKKMLMYAEKAFLLLYQSRDINEDTKRNWRDNWHTIAPPFRTLIDKSTKTKTKKDISPRKEETLLALIGILADKHFVGNKYKKTDGLHKTSTIAEDIINHISKQLPDNHIPHGFKKSNLIEIINNSLDCWNKKKDV